MMGIWAICIVLVLGASSVLIIATRRLNPKTGFAEIQELAGTCMEADKKYRRQELPETDASDYVALARCFIGKQILKEEKEEEAP